MKFELWKAEYEPRIYEDTGAHCYEHEEENNANPENWCDCEYLYTFDVTDKDEKAEVEQAIRERRAWTWRGDGTIVSGVEVIGGDILITAKPFDDFIVVR